MSNINTANIDDTYPKQGKDNPSQGFRDNFSYIKIALDTAASEITAIQEMANLSTTTDYLGLLTGLQVTADQTGTHLSILDNKVIAVQTTATNNFNSIITLQNEIDLLSSNTGSFLRTYTGNISASNVNALGGITANSIVNYGVTNLNTVSNITITGGTSGQVLTTNGNGHLHWSTVTGGGGSGSGLNTSFQVGLSRDVTFADSTWSFGVRQLQIPFDTLSGNSGQFDSNDPAGFNPQGTFNFNFTQPGGNTPAVIPAFVAPTTGLYYFYSTVHLEANITNDTYSSLCYFLLAYDSSGNYVSELSSNSTTPLYYQHSTQYSISINGAIPLPAGGYVYPYLDVNNGPNGANLTVTGYQTYFGGMQLQ